MSKEVGAGGRFDIFLDCTKHTRAKYCDVPGNKNNYSRSICSIARFSFPKPHHKNEQCIILTKVSGHFRICYEPILSKIYLQSSQAIYVKTCALVSHKLSFKLN